MDDDEINNPVQSDTKNNAYTIPVAIIVAGAMVAGAVMYGGGSGVPAPKNGSPAQNQPAAVGAELSDDIKAFLAERPGDYVFGNPDAPVTITEFGDFECPFCAQFHIVTRPQIIDKYVKTGQVKLLWRHFPLTAIHKQAEPTSVAAECAGEQGKFWQYHDIVFETKKFDNASLAAHAGTINLNIENFKSCIDSDKYLEKVRSETNLGLQAGVSGTPSFFVNGELIVGAVPLSSFEPLILKALGN